jgi:hypothetical protein
VKSMERAVTEMLALDFDRVFGLYRELLTRP